MIGTTEKGLAFYIFGTEVVTFCHGALMLVLIFIFRFSLNRVIQVTSFKFVAVWLKLYTGVPSPQQRYEILLALLSEMRHSLSDKDVLTLAMDTHGFVGADLAALCNEAALVCLRQFVNLNVCIGESDFKFSTAANDSVRSTSNRSHIVCLSSDMDICQVLGDSVNSNLEASFSHDSEIESSSDFMDGTGATGACALKGDLKVTSVDFEKARDRIRPSAMREVSTCHLFYSYSRWAYYLFFRLQ